MSLRLIKYFRSPTAILSDWTSLNPTLAKGEISYLLNNSVAISAKVGPGAWNSIPYLGKNLPDKLHTLNVTGAASSGSGVGFEIEENALITGYFKTSTARTGFDIKPPAATSNARLLFSSLTLDREYTFPNASGTLLLTNETLVQNNIPFIGVGGVLTQDTGFSYNSTTDIISVGGQTVSVGTGTQNYVSKWTSTGNVLGNSTIINTGFLTTVFHAFASTNTVEPILRVQRESTGTPAIGIGGSIDFAVETSANVNTVLGKIQGVARAITLGTEVGSTRIISKLSSGVFTGIEITADDAASGTSIKPYISTGTTSLTIDCGTTDLNLITGSIGQILIQNQDLITLQSTGLNNTIVYIANDFEVTSSEISLISLQTSTGNSPLSALKVSTIAGIPAIGTGTGIDFETYVGSGNYVIGSSIKSVSTDITISSEDFDLVFNTMTNGAAAAEKLRVQSNGYLKLATLPANDDALTQILVRDSTGLIKYRNASSIGAAGNGHVIYNGSDVSPVTQRLNLRFTNGLSASDSTPDTLAKLGGALTENTSITGAFNLNLSTSNISLFSATPNFNSGTNILFVSKSTTRPTAPPTDGVYIWAEENDAVLALGTTRLMIMDSNGNIRAL
jgi:hypothetical protein